MLDGRTVFTDSYRYGFQGQEGDDEVSGEGNSYTATFWQYSPRVGKRWNIDPVVKEHESPYAAFANNPIWFRDSNGADTTRNNEGELSWEFEDGDTYYNIGKRLKEYGITLANESKNLQGAYDAKYNTYELHKHTGKTILLEGVLGDNKLSSVFDEVLIQRQAMAKQLHMSLALNGCIYQQYSSGVGAKLSSLNSGIGYLASFSTAIGGSIRFAKYSNHSYLLSPKHYSSGWTGGGPSQIKTYNLTRFGRVAGGLTFGYSVLSDSYGVYNYYRYGEGGAAHTVKPEAALTNTFSAGLMTWGGPIGFVVGLMHVAGNDAKSFGVDNMKDNLQETVGDEVDLDGWMSGND